MSDSLDIKKLMKDNAIAFYAIAAVVVVLVVYLILFVPILRKLGLKYAECRNYESQLWDARNTIEYAVGIDKACGGRVLISEKEASAGIEELTGFGKSLGINFSQIKPGAVTQGEGAYKVLPIEIDMEATGDQFIKFMGSIDELKKAIITIRSFSVTPDKNDGNSLKINIVANVYLSR